MNYRLKKRAVINGGQFVPGHGVAGISSGVTSAARRDVAMRNFILQQGFADPGPATLPRQYAALVFQPKVVLITIVAGILLQSEGVFLALGAVLWWSALFPRLNPISALYNRTMGRRPGA